MKATTVKTNKLKMIKHARVEKEEEGECMSHCKK